MDPAKEHTLAHLRRLLRENAERDPDLLASSRKAIDESRRLLQRIDRDHPELNDAAHSPYPGDGLQQKG